LTKIESTLGDFGPPNFNGGRPQILDLISKITPISDLLSYNNADVGCNVCKLENLSSRIDMQTHAGPACLPLTMHSQ